MFTDINAAIEEARYMTHLMKRPYAVEQVHHEMQIVRSDQCLNPMYIAYKGNEAVKGITYCRGSGSYQVRITVDGIRHYVGKYKRIEDAQKAYDQFVKENVRFMTRGVVNTEVA